MLEHVLQDDDIELVLDFLDHDAGIAETFGNVSLPGYVDRSLGIVRREDARCSGVSNGSRCLTGTASDLEDSKTFPVDLAHDLRRNVEGGQGEELFLPARVNLFVDTLQR